MRRWMESSGVLLSIEGRAAQKYWAGVKQLFLTEVDWPGRRTQGATDAVNSALNYGYGILYGQVERALVLAGLDPYAGFLHVDRPGKPSLVFDLVEEFRQTVVDRTVIAIFNRAMAVELDERGRLVEASRRSIAERSSPGWMGRNRMKASVTHCVPSSNCRRAIWRPLCRGDRAAYEPFVASW